MLSKLAKEADFHPFTTNFLNLLVDKKRIGNVSSIIDEFENLYCDSTDTQIATVTSAVKLENEQQFMIAKKKIQEMTGAKNIKLKPEVDPALLGGFVVTYGKDGSGTSTCPSPARLPSSRMRLSLSRNDDASVPRHARARARAGACHARAKG